MAKLSSCLILMSLFIATTTFAEPESIIQCAKYIGVPCGNQVFRKLFGHKTTDLSTHCCYKLIQTGYICHTKMALAVLKTYPQLKDLTWLDILFKADKIYDTCDQLTKPVSPKYLAKCTEEIGSQCGEEVFDELIHDKSMSKNCCGKLVKMGEKCHLNMAKELIRTPEMRSANATQILIKNEEIFHKCQK